MRYFSISSLFFVSTLCADVSRFIDETIDLPITEDSSVITLTKSSALISHRLTDLDYKHSISSPSQSLTLNRELLESKLSESIAHRYQTSGRIVAYLSREWHPIEVSSNFIVKIKG